MRTTLWRYHLGGGCVLALAYVYLPLAGLRIGALVVLCLAAIAATLASIRRWRPAHRLPFLLFAAGEAVGFVAGSLGSSAAVTRAGGSVAAAALTMVAYVIGIVGYAILIRTRSPGRDRASLIDATVISTGVGMLAWVFLASPYSVDASLPLIERVLSMLYVVLDVLVLALVIRLAIGGGDRSRAYLLMTAGWLVLVAADIGRAVLVLVGSYDPLQPGRGRLAGLLQDRQGLRRRRRRRAEESAVARAIIALAGTLHLDTVAEGVEHPEQATALAELGCRLAQGFHFSRPVPAADLTTRLAGQQPVAGLRHPA